MTFTHRKPHTNFEPSKLPDDSLPICPIHLLDIHRHGTLIGVLEKKQNRIQLLVWQDWLVEIECQHRHQEWIPVRIQFQLESPSYQALLEQHLNSHQLQCLRLAIQACQLN